MSCVEWSTLYSISIKHIHWTKGHLVLVKRCTIAKCLIHFKNNDRTMAVAIQNIVIKAFHNFMLFLSVVFLLSYEKSWGNVVLSGHLKSNILRKVRWVRVAKKWTALDKNTVIELHSCKNDQAATSYMEFAVISPQSSVHAAPAGLRCNIGQRHTASWF